MPLTMEQVRLVTRSYSQISSSLHPYSELFYNRLLLNHPFARALFPDDMTHQMLVFSKTIDVLVENIADLAQLRPTLTDLAKKHVKYGVKAYQYAAVGTVLIDTFAELLGNNFTHEVRQAWELVYAETAGVMISAGYPENQSTRPDILVKRGAEVVQIIDTKWKRIAARIDDPKQGVSQAEVYQMMAYARLYGCDRVMLLYPYHVALGGYEGVLATHRIQGGEGLLETATIDIAIAAGIGSRLRSLVVHDAP